MKSPVFINLENILSELGISRTALYQRIRAGIFPEIVKLGTRSLGWSSEEFQDVVNAIRAGLTDYEMQDLVREIHKGRSKFKDVQPFKRRALSYDPELDSAFCEKRPTYEERYILHDPLSDECIARWRRLRAFKTATGLVEECRIPSFKHLEICNWIRDLDHTSYWWFGQIPLVMTECYRGEPTLSESLSHIILPSQIGPYGGGPWESHESYQAPAVSILYAKFNNRGHLDKIGEMISEAASNSSRWNQVTDAERQAANASVEIMGGFDE